MSQISHTLLLFFNNEKSHKHCLLMFHKLAKDDPGEAAKYAALLHVDIEQTWNEDWFNQSLSAATDHIALHFDTSTSYRLPLALLQQLFAAGLGGAAIESFNDQVGETCCHFFADGKLVNEGDLYAMVPRAKDIVNAAFDGDGESELLEEPVPIPKLIKQEKRSQEEAEATVHALQEMLGVARETGSNPLEMMKSILLIRAGAKGLFHAVLFGLVTILLFKGVWLWVILSLLLAVILPLYYMNRELSELKPKSGSDDDEGDGEVEYVD